MKKVVLIRSNPVSPDPPVEKAANTLIKSGYKVTVIGWDRDRDYYSENSTLELADGCADIVRFGIKASFGAGFRGNLKPLLTFQKRLKEWLGKNSENYDIIHAFDFDTAAVASFAAKKYKKKFIYHILDFYADSHNLGKLRPLIKKFDFSIINNADVTIICTEKRKKQIRGSKPKKLVAIHNTPDCKVSENAPRVLSEKSCPDKIKIVYVGVLVETHMIEDIIEFVGKNPDKYEFHIGGFGMLESYIAQKAEEYPNVFFYGKLPYENTLSLENDCDLMVALYDPVVRNHRYCAPNKFYEAIMLGKPIIMANNTGFDDIIRENNIGITVDFSKQGLESGISALAERRNEWAEMAERENALYNKQFSWRIMAQRIKRLYKDLDR
ncbi:MAG TPA: glycosyltransferase [Ruminococcus sp.]|nr:glycosyltransferase [Ruminococcus sp.]